MSSSAQPVLADGTLILRAWRVADFASAIAGHDEEVRHWLGLDDPTEESLRAALESWRQGWRTRTLVNFVVEVDETVAGWVEVRSDGTTGELSWALFPGSRGQGVGRSTTSTVRDRTAGANSSPRNGSKAGWA